MGINNFLYSIFALAILFMYIEQKEVVIEEKKEEKPTVSFYNSVMYDITSQSVTQMIQSSQAYMYKKREELVDGIIVTKVEKKEDEESEVNMIKADYIIKMADNIYLDGDVNLQLGNDIELKTEQLEYNMKTEIAKNNVAFDMRKNKSSFLGDQLYFDTKNNHIIAKNTKIKIKVSENEDEKR